MPKEIEFDGVVHEFPDDFTDDDIAAALGGGQSEPAQGKSLTQKAADMLPMAGGMVGSLVGGGIPGAALGGAAGQGYGQLLKHLGEIPGAVMDVGRNLMNPATRGATIQGGMEGMTKGVKDAGISGAIQGGSEAVGGVLAKGMKAAAPRLMQSMVKPSKAIRDSFPTVAQDMVDRGVAIGGKAGQPKVGKLLTKAGNAVNEKLQLAQRLGAKPIDMNDVIPSLQSVAQKVAKEPLDGSAKLAEVTEIGGRLRQQHPNPIPLLEAQEMKQAAQRVASQGYKQLDAGAPINSVTPDANMAIARGLREQIEQRANVGPLNEEVQKLIGIDRALEGAMGRISNNQPIGMNALIASGVGAGAYGASGDIGTGGGVGLGIIALTNPYLASRLAIGANKLAPAARQLPNAARAALMAQLASE
jgi:hypothetical protein